MKKATQLSVSAKAQPTGEFGQTLWISLCVPADFQLDNPKSKEPYSRAWNQNRALPPEHPFYSSLEKMKKHFRIPQMLFVVKGNKSNLEFVLTAPNRDATTERLEKMLGGNITFC